MTSKRLYMIFSESEMKRIAISAEQNSQLSIKVDVHGLKCYEAKRFLNNLINIVQDVFILIVIHGYNHGTAIKEMLAKNFNNKHVQHQYTDPHNLGVTNMLIV